MFIKEKMTKLSLEYKPAPYKFKPYVEQVIQKYKNMTILYKIIIKRQEFFDFKIQSFSDFLHFFEN